MIDSVENATATPEREQPYAALGLKADEYQRIRDILGRRPTSGELAMYSVMWSEHCSYKSSKVHLRQFGAKVSPEMTKNLMVGMGENAGVVDIGEGWAVTFKIESHNHPSYIEPFQGAATGVGGIVRDAIRSHPGRSGVEAPARSNPPLAPVALRVTRDGGRRRSQRLKRALPPPRRSGGPRRADAQKSPCATSPRNRVQLRPFFGSVIGAGACPELVAVARA